MRRGQRLVVIGNLKMVDNENAEDGADDNGATDSSVAGQKAIEENSNSISMNLTLLLMEVMIFVGSEISWEI